MPDPSLLSVTSPGLSEREAGQRLTSAPPLPPDSERPARKHMDELMKKHSSDRNDPDMGMESANPFVRKMMSMKNIEMGIRDAVASDPSLSPVMAQILQAAQMAIMGSITGSTGVGPAPGPLSLNLPPPGMGGGPPGPSPFPGPAVAPMPAPGGTPQ